MVFCINLFLYCVQHSPVSGMSRWNRSKYRCGKRIDTGHFWRGYWRRLPVECRADVARRTNTTGATRKMIKSSSLRATVAICRDWKTIYRYLHSLRVAQPSGVAATWRENGKNEIQSPFEISSWSTLIVFGTTVPYVWNKIEYDLFETRDFFLFVKLQTFDVENQYLLNVLIRKNLMKFGK